MSRVPKKIKETMFSDPQANALARAASINPISVLSRLVLGVRPGKTQGHCKAAWEAQIRYATNTCRILDFIKHTVEENGNASVTAAFTNGQSCDRQYFKRCNYFESIKTGTSNISRNPTVTYSGALAIHLTLF